MMGDSERGGENKRGGLEVTHSLILSSITHLNTHQSTHTPSKDKMKCSRGQQKRKKRQPKNRRDWRGV